MRPRPWALLVLGWIGGGCQGEPPPRDAPLPYLREGSDAPRWHPGAQVTAVQAFPNLQFGAARQLLWRRGGEAVDNIGYVVTRAGALRRFEGRPAVRLAPVVLDGDGGAVTRAVVWPGQKGEVLGILRDAPDGTGQLFGLLRIGPPPAWELLLRHDADRAGRIVALAAAPDDAIYLGLDASGRDSAQRGGVIVRLPRGSGDLATRLTHAMARPVAWGFHSPGAISFDRDGAVWIADDGQGGWELNKLKLGQHYGWPQREGRRCRGESACAGGGYRDPEHWIAVAAPSQRSAVAFLPSVRQSGVGSSLAGALVYAHRDGGLWARPLHGNATARQPQLLRQHDAAIADLAVDSSGRLFLIEADSGIVRELVARPR